MPRRWRTSLAALTAGAALAGVIAAQLAGTYKPAGGSGTEVAVRCPDPANCTVSNHNQVLL